MNGQSETLPSDKTNIGRGGCVRWLWWANQSRWKPLMPLMRPGLISKVFGTERMGNHGCIES